MRQSVVHRAGGPPLGRSGPLMDIRCCCQTPSSSQVRRHRWARAIRRALRLLICSKMTRDVLRAYVLKLVIELTLKMGYLLQTLVSTAVQRERSPWTTFYPMTLSVH